MSNIIKIVLEYLPALMDAGASGIAIAKKYIELIGTAHGEGRDVTDAELDDLQADRQSAVDAAMDALDGN